MRLILTALHRTWCIQYVLTCIYLPIHYLLCTYTTTSTYNTPPGVVVRWVRWLGESQVTGKVHTVYLQVDVACRLITREKRRRKELGSWELVHTHIHTYTHVFVFLWTTCRESCGVIRKEGRKKGRKKRSVIKAVYRYVCTMYNMYVRLWLCMPLYVEMCCMYVYTCVCMVARTSDVRREETAVLWRVER